MNNKLINIVGDYARKNPNVDFDSILEQLSITREDLFEDKQTTGMKDRFLVKQALYRRLMEDYEKHGYLVVAYDLDNTVKPFYDKDDTFPKLRKLLKRLKAAGHFLICFTANDTETTKQYLIDNSIPFEVVNKNPPFFEESYRKIYYNVLLDDRAGLREAYKALKKFLKKTK